MLVTGRLLSVNVGRPRVIEWDGKTVRTAIWKEPVDAPHDDPRRDPRLPQPRHAHGQARHQWARRTTARDAGVVRARRRGAGVHDLGRLSQGPEPSPRSA